MNGLLTHQAAFSPTTHAASRALDLAQLTAFTLGGQSISTEGIGPVFDVSDRERADAHQLHQVIVNLIANAYQALRRHPQPRRIAIRTRHDA